MIAKLRNLAILAVLLWAGPAAAACDFRVESIPDGDTVYSHVMRVVTPTVAKPYWTRFRLDDVLTPERGERDWQKARVDLVQLAWGSPLDIEILEERDPHKGFIVNLWRCENGKRYGPSINERMRKLGWDKYGRGVPSKQREESNEKQNSNAPEPTTTEREPGVGGDS